MTDIIAKPFDWNDNLSKEAIEDFETIRGKLTYCTHQSIGLALAKLELLEKQGCKVIEPSGGSSEKPKSEWQQDHEILKAYSDGANDVLDKIRAEIEQEYNCLSATRADETLELGECLGLKMSLKIIDEYKPEAGETE